MTEFVQFLVLAFTALVWWLARRDLTANASRLRAASSAEVDRLRETVEALTAALEERVTTEEKRLSALIVEARSLQAPLVPRSVETVAASVPPQAAPAAVLSEAEPASAAPVSPIESVKPPAPPMESAKLSALESSDAPMPPAAPTIAVENAGDAKSDENIPAPSAAVSTAAPARSAPVSDASPASPVAVSAAAPPAAAPAASGLHTQVMEAERRAALVRAQLAIGRTDAIEIARRTGLPRGEVELLIGLRALRIEPETPAAAFAAAAPISEAAAEAPVEAALDGSSSESVDARTPSPVSEPAEDDRYAAIYAMLASGVTNSTEIARRTGMGRGEVELILGLRARNVL